MQDNVEERIFKFDHSEFIRFFQRNYPQNIVSENQILDDDFIYLFPIEIRSTLGSLNDLNTFPLEGTIYQYYFKDVLSSTILNHLKSGKVKTGFGEPRSAFSTFNEKKFERFSLPFQIIFPSAKNNL